MAISGESRMVFERGRQEVLIPNPFLFANEALCTLYCMRRAIHPL